MHTSVEIVTPRHQVNQYKQVTHFQDWKYTGVFCSFFLFAFELYTCSWRHHCILHFHCKFESGSTSLVAQMVKRLPTTWETPDRFLGWEDIWRRKWQPTLGLLPGKSHGQRSVVGYSPWGHKESGMTERLHFH